MSSVNREPSERTNMTTPPNLWDAARREMEEYKLAADLELQPKWDVPEKMVIHTAVSGRLAGTEGGLPSTFESFVGAAGEVIEGGAAGVHVDFTWVEDPSGRRLDRDVPPVEAYSAVLEPLRERFGSGFVADCNLLNGKTFEECMSPARAGLPEMAPCAPGHPDEWMIPAIETMEEIGVKPMLAPHSSGELELAKRKLIDTGILKKPYFFGILYGLPFDTGRSLVSGTWVRNTRDMAQHLILMVDQIRAIDPESVIMVSAAGRATLYMTTLATMLGLHIRVGTEDTVWKYPNSDERFTSNREMLDMARQIAELHGRVPATADEYRQLVGIPVPAAV